MRLPSNDLIARYGGPAPRYTSYPPAPVWSEAVGPDAYLSALAAISASGISAPFSLYVHIPFCRKRCWYCGCNVAISPDRTAADGYLDAIDAEANALPRIDRPLASLHLGGGTPNDLRREQMTRLLEILKARFQFGPDTAMDIEVDPRVTTPDDVTWLVRQGFRRLSFGVQDLDPSVGEAVGRVMDAGHVTELLAAARAAGVRGINVDLMYGLPRQTPESLGNTLDAVIRMGPDRLALYGYAHVPQMRPQQRRLERAGLPSPQERVALFARATEVLTEAGYRHIGLDHFAKPDDSLVRAFEAGTLQRSFQGYTTRETGDLVGLGASAIGFLRSAERPLLVQNVVAVKPYERIGGVATCRGHALDKDDLRRGGIIRDILCAGGVSDPDLWTRYPEAWNALTDAEADGLVERSDQGLRITELGQFFLRPIAAAFDAYMETSRRYSMAV